MNRGQVLCERTCRFVNVTEEGDASGIQTWQSVDSDDQKDEFRLQIPEQLVDEKILSKNVHVVFYEIPASQEQGWSKPPASLPLKDCSTIYLRNRYLVLHFDASQNMLIASNSGLIGLFKCPELIKRAPVKTWLEMDMSPITN